MDITVKGYSLNLTPNELWTLSFSLKRDLEESIRNHYVNHQNGAFERNESEKVEMLKAMFTYQGRVDLYEEIFKFKEKVFKEFNDLKDKK